MALKIVGSSPIIHPIKTGDIFGYLLFLYGIWWIMGLERPKRKQSGGLFSGRGRVPSLPTHPLRVRAEGKNRMQRLRITILGVYFDGDDGTRKAVKKTVRWTNITG